jgi:hypothetical protein
VSSQIHNLYAIVSLHRAAKRLRVFRVAMSNDNEELLTPIACVVPGHDPVLLDRGHLFGKRSRRFPGSGRRHGTAEDREPPVIFRACIAVSAEPSQDLAS